MSISKSGKKASEEVQGERERVFVLDFLYCDTRRIGSFLAQFDDSGTLQQIVQSEEAFVDGKRGFSLSVGGGATLAGTGGQGSLSIERPPATGGSEASFRVYDPLWANAVVFLDYLEEKKLIHRNLKNSPFGSFVLIKGSLSVTDFSILKNLWNFQTMKDKIVNSQQPSQNRKQRRAQGFGRQSDDVTDSLLGLDFMGSLPHLCHIDIKDGYDHAWGSLVEENIAVEKSDIFLKHGRRIPGDWSVLGILDARPYDNILENEAQIPENYDAFLHGFSCIIDVVAPMLRKAMGRPITAYGITPLIVFRQVQSSVELDG